MRIQDFELPGAFTLADHTDTIAGAEATGRKFVGSKIWTNSANEISNLATFELLSKRPDPPLGSPVLKTKLGAGEVAAWSGPMIVEGKALGQVFLVRVAAP